MGYIIKSGYYQMKLLTQRESFDRALKDPRLDDTTKKKILLVEEAKKFAEDKLHLTRTSSYSSFVLLDDKYVTYAVTAAYKDRLEAYTWWFPIVGSVPYKGFFKKADGEDEMASLKAKDLDVMMRGVQAYSTLGWFADPLLSSMTAYDDADLVETVIHETTHATIYIKSNADFNERLAVFVGTKGMEDFYRQKEGAGSKAIERAAMIASDAKIFGDFITVQLNGLENWYKDHKGSPTLLQDREEEFKKIQVSFKAQCLPRLKSSSYKYFGEQKINNAVLLSYKTYFQNLDIFEKAFDKCGRDWAKFLERVKSLKASKDPEKDLRAFAEAPPAA